MRSNSKMRLYDKLAKEFKEILRHKESGQCVKSLGAYKRIPKHYNRIVKIENAEAKREYAQYSKIKKQQRVVRATRGSYAL